MNEDEGIGRKVHAANEGTGWFWTSALFDAIPAGPEDLGGMQEFDSAATLRRIARIRMRLFLSYEK